MTFLTALTRFLVSAAAGSFFVGFLLNVVLGVPLTRGVFAAIWVLAAAVAAAFVFRTVPSLPRKH